MEKEKKLIASPFIFSNEYVLTDYACFVFPMEQEDEKPAKYWLEFLGSKRARLCFAPTGCQKESIDFIKLAKLLISEAINRFELERIENKSKKDSSQNLPKPFEYAKFLPRLEFDIKTRLNFDEGEIPIMFVTSCQFLPLMVFEGSDESHSRCLGIIYYLSHDDEVLSKVVIINSRMVLGSVKLIENKEEFLGRDINPLMEIPNKLLLSSLKEPSFPQLGVFPRDYYLKKKKAYRPSTSSEKEVMLPSSLIFENLEKLKSNWLKMLFYAHSPVDDNFLAFDIHYGAKPMTAFISFLSDPESISFLNSNTALHNNSKIDLAKAMKEYSLGVKDSKKKQLYLSYYEVIKTCRKKDLRMIRDYLVKQLQRLINIEDIKDFDLEKSILKKDGFSR